MQIVLLADIDKVGKRGDITEVADGFARNYLIPRGHAILASKGVTAQAKSMRASRDRKDKKSRDAAQLIADKLQGISIRVTQKAGTEGRLFGSVTNADLVDALSREAGVAIERRQIELHDPIKTTGSHSVPVKLHPDVRADVTVEVVAADD